MTKDITLILYLVTTRIHLFSSQTESATPVHTRPILTSRRSSMHLSVLAREQTRKHVVHKLELGCISCRRREEQDILLRSRPDATSQPSDQNAGVSDTEVERILLAP